MPRYRIEAFKGDGRFIQQVYLEAETMPQAEGYGMAHFSAPLFRERQRGEGYIHVTLSPHAPSDGTCTRCGCKRWQCGGESDPHE